MTVEALLSELLHEVQTLKANQTRLEEKVTALSQSGPKGLGSSDAQTHNHSNIAVAHHRQAASANGAARADTAHPDDSASSSTSPSVGAQAFPTHYPYRAVLTTYPGQNGIDPVPMKWFSPHPATRGPIIASRHPTSLKRRNAIGAYSGGYSIYRALACAMGSFHPDFVPSYENTEPAFDVPFNDAWSSRSKVVAMDPWGHVAPQLWHAEFESGLDIRPTIAITRAHLKVSELDEAAKEGRLQVDGKIVIPSPSNPHAQTQLQSSDLSRGSTPAQEKHTSDAGVEVNVGKCAVEPVWYLPGVAERFGITEEHLRRSLFEETGGMYPELLTRNDLKVFLPPIGGLTVYIFGNPAFLRDESKELTLRIHDECNGSDVFGSDICTCRPYLLYGIEEAIKCSQRDGIGVVIYFRKEGRSLGEVTKYLVYNARKRGGDTAATYFKRTQDIAGVKDMRFQVLSTDVLHWLGIKKVDNMISMSDMKHDAIVNSGIPIHKRYDLPQELIPPDSMVEIDAKIASGYFSANKTLNEDQLGETVGRAWDTWQWDDVSH